MPITASIIRGSGIGPVAYILRMSVINKELLLTGTYFESATAVKLNLWQLTGSLKVTTLYEWGTGTAYAAQG